VRHSAPHLANGAQVAVTDYSKNCAHEIASYGRTCRRTRKGAAEIDFEFNGTYI
jgi:hypothetical protein